VGSRPLVEEIAGILRGGGARPDLSGPCGQP